MTEKKKVLIIGAGFGGIEAAKALDKNFDVTVVERKKYFFNNIAAVRLALDADLVNKLYIPYDKLLKNGKIIFSTVTEITPTLVTLEDGQQLTFDYLIIATGSNSLAPFKTSLSLQDSEIRSYYTSLSQQIKQAQNILIVGGGVVAIEFIGEIRDVYKDKKITMVHSGEKLVNDKMTVKFNDKITSAMKKRNVNVILKDRITMPDSVKDNLKNQQSPVFQVTPNGGTNYTTEGGVTIESVDLVFWTVGTKINSESYFNAFSNVINEHGQIKVNSSLQVSGYENIFAIGDITDIVELKTSYNAKYHGVVVGKVIDQLAKGDKKNKLPEHKPTPAMLGVSMGKDDGVLQLPNGMVLGGFFTKMIKSKSLFTDMIYKALNSPKQFQF